MLNSELPFGKDAAYELLKGQTYNWRRLLLSLGLRLFGVFNRLTSDERESVLIIDDSPYDRSRSKWVELLARIWDHSTGRFLKGFRMLTICGSDGTSCLPMDFSLLSSSNAEKRLCDSQKELDKRCCAYQRRKETTEKATAHLQDMAKRILSLGVSAKYLLMDSWFTMPATVVTLAQLIKIVGMVKKSSRIHSTFNGQSLDLMTIYLGISGSGEPSLNSKIGLLIKEIKQRTTVPVAVPTNGSLLWVPAFRSALMGRTWYCPLWMWATIMRQCCP